jgi:hypothetical protein
MAPDGLVGHTETEIGLAANTYLMRVLIPRTARQKAAAIRLLAVVKIVGRREASRGCGIPADGNRVLVVRRFGGVMPHQVRPIVHAEAPVRMLPDQRPAAWRACHASGSQPPLNHNFRIARDISKTDLSAASFSTPTLAFEMEAGDRGKENHSESNKPTMLRMLSRS